jgi:solute carrier family 25 (adenine nucleotide translocator) protein 4/5/6/31
MMQSGAKVKKFTGPVDCFKKLYQKNGLRGFYKGCMTDCLTGLGTSLILVLYEDAKKVLSSTQH